MEPLDPRLVKRQGIPAFLQNATAAQGVYVDHRKRVADMLKEMDVEDLEVGPEDIKLLLLMRSVGFGCLSVKVQNGRPVKVSEAQTEIDLTKALDST